MTSREEVLERLLDEAEEAIDKANGRLEAELTAAASVHLVCERYEEVLDAEMRAQIIRSMMKNGT